MTEKEDTADRIRRLDERIAAARKAQREEFGQEAKYSGAALAWRMVTELVVGVMIGLGMGWGLDSLFGTLPIFLMLFGLLGFAAGVRTMIRSAEEMKRRGAARRAEAADKSDGAGSGAAKKG